MINRPFTVFGLRSVLSLKHFKAPRVCWRGLNRVCFLIAQREAGQQEGRGWVQERQRETRRRRRSASERRRWRRSGSREGESSRGKQVTHLKVLPETQLLTQSWVTHLLLLKRELTVKRTRLPATVGSHIQCLFHDCRHDQMVSSVTFIMKSGVMTWLCSFVKWGEEQVF